MSDEFSGGLVPLPRRRMVSEAGAEASVEKPPHEIADRAGETRRVVKRLLAIIDDHRIAAERLGVALDGSLLEAVIGALEAEVRREDPKPWLQPFDEVRSYVATALYEELLEEPSNILFTTQVSPDVVRYEAMEGEFWAGCVAALRQLLIRPS